MNYQIKGEPLPVLMVDLEPNESIKCQKGAMAWMSPNMKMETKTGSIGAAFNKLMTRESIFQNQYTAQGGAGMIAFASTVPGTIIPFDLANGDIIVQKGGYLASSPSVEISIAFQRKIGAGFFGGEGFIMQRLSGKGMAFVEIDGCAIQYDLQAGQQLIVDTGYLAAMSGTCTMDIKTVEGIGNALFGGEGLFNTVVTGPGRVYLQTMPINQLAGAISGYIPSR